MQWDVHDVLRHSKTGAWFSLQRHYCVTSFIPRNAHSRFHPCWRGCACLREATAPVSWRRRWRLLDQGSISTSGAMSPASPAWGSACKERSSLSTTRPRCWLWVSFYRRGLSLRRRDEQLHEAWAGGTPKTFSPRRSSSTLVSLPCLACVESGGVRPDLRLVITFYLRPFFANGRLQCKCKDMNRSHAEMVWMKAQVVFCAV